MACVCVLKRAQWHTYKFTTYYCLVLYSRVKKQKKNFCRWLWRIHSFFTIGKRGFFFFFSRKSWIFSKKFTLRLVISIEISLFQTGNIMKKKNVSRNSFTFTSRSDLKASLFNRFLGSIRSYHVFYKDIIPVAYG